VVKGTAAQVAAARKVLEQKRAVFDDTVVQTIEVDKKHHKALIGASGKSSLSSRRCSMWHKALIS
jgi:hypothetical protein